MTEQEQIKAKIAKAEKMCKEATEAWREAQEELDGFVTTNGYGVFHEQGLALRRRLIGARAAITTALEALDAIEWPTEADYDNV